MKTLRTWARQSNFKYSGSVPTGTEISYGTDHANRVIVSQFHYHDLLRHFSGREVKIGTSRTDPPAGSLGAWLQTHVINTAIASYVGPILIHEGFAEQGSQSDRIKFNG